MRGVASHLARLQGIAAFLAGAALLTSASQSARAQAALVDERAMLVPNVSAGAPLPRVLPPSEANRVRLIFRLQASGAIEAARREADKLDTSTALGTAMLGHVLADRYLGPYTRPDVGALQDWLARFADLPDAASIHALLRARLPARSHLAPLPPASSMPEADNTPPPPMPEEVGPAQTDIARNIGLDRDIADAARRGASAVNRLLGRTRGLSPAYASLLRGEAARILFTLGRDEEALSLGQRGARVTGDEQPGADQAHQDSRVAALPGFVAGLAAWRLGRVELARGLFEAAYRAPLGNASLRAAAAFWAARAHLRGREAGSYAPWLSRASAERFTFYGLIARRMQGLGVGSAPGERELGGREVLAEADIEAIQATAPGLRALALLQIGQRGRAEAELRLMWPLMRDSAPLARAVMLVADQASLAGLAAEIADHVQAADGRPRESTRFRVPRLRPDGGFRVDPALIYALARTESNFDTALVSNAGARGILQIMPETASFIAAGNAAGDEARRERLTRLLHDPAINLDLGQRYVSYLAEHPAIDGNMVRLLAAYNAGPASLARWSETMRDDDDPLLFIEAIPIDETRAFVPRVLTYTWIFAKRLRLPSPSLDDLARGAWPHYVPMVNAPLVH